MIIIIFSNVCLHPFDLALRASCGYWNATFVLKDFWKFHSRVKALLPIFLLFLKKIHMYLFIILGSMYRFNGHDSRLDRMLESTLMVMEAFEGYGDKVIKKSH